MGIPWRRKWQPTPVFLPGESHGQRSLAGYSPWHRKETDTTEQLTLLLSSSRGWDPRALSQVTTLLARSCAGGSPICPQGLPLSHSAPSPAPTCSPALAPALQVPLVAPAVTLHSHCPLCWTCCFSPFFGCVGVGPPVGGRHTFGTKWETRD